VSGEHRDSWLRQQRLGRLVGEAIGTHNKAVEKAALAEGWEVAREYDRRVRLADATGHDGIAFTLRLPVQLAGESPTPAWVLGGQIGLVKADIRRTFRRQGPRPAFAMYATQPSRAGLPHWHGVLMVPAGEMEDAKGRLQKIVRERVDAQLGDGAASKHRVLMFSDPIEVWRNTERFSGREPLTGWVWYVLRPYLTSWDAALAHGQGGDAEGRTYPTRQADAVTARAWLWANAIGAAYTRSRSD
jgi:hypothetical protein